MHQSTQIKEPKINLYKWCRRKRIKPNTSLLPFAGINLSKFKMEAQKFEIEKYNNRINVVQKVLFCVSSYYIYEIVIICF